MAKCRLGLIASLIALVMAMSAVEVTAPLPFIVDILLLVVFVIAGAAIIILLQAAIFFLPAIVLALVVWWFTHSLAYAGLAFAIIAILSILKRSDSG